MYYRKDLLAAAHMSPPTTWEQLETDASTLVKDNKVKYGFVWQGDSYEGLTCNFMEYLASAGGTATNSAFTQATLNSAAATKAVTFMRSLITSGASPAAVTTFQEPQAMNTFGAGNAAFLRNWDYAYSAATTPSSGGKLTASQVGVEPMPTFQGQPAPGYSNIGGWNMYINPHSKNIAADLTFIKWLSTPAAQDILSKRYGFISTVQAVRTDPSVIALEPGVRRRAEDQAGPAARGHAQLPGAVHRDLPERERGPGRVGLPVVGGVVHAVRCELRTIQHIQRRFVTRRRYCPGPGSDTLPGPGRLPRPSAGNTYLATPALLIPAPAARSYP